MADQYAKWNSEHAARNSGSDSAVGGGASVNLPGPKAKVPPVRHGNADVKAIGKVAGGKIETMSGKNVV